MSPATLTAGGYRATRDGSTLIVHDVEIFCECSRGDVDFDGGWIAAAVSKAMQSASEGYFPPLHIRHHDPSDDSMVAAAGFFRITGTAPITLKGKRRIAILADLVLTSQAAIDEVLSKRLPYRSVEIFNVDDPAIDSLALLDHEAPFLELPMLMVSGVSPGSAGASPSVLTSFGAGPLVAFSRRGLAAALMFEGSTMTDSTKPTGGKPDEPTPKDQPALFEADEAPKKDDDKESEGEDMEGEGLDVAGVVKAIESGEISVADMDAILAAIQAQRGTDEPAEDEEMPAPAAAPGGESMKKTSPEMIAMAAKLAALEIKDRKRDETDKRKADVDAAMVKFSKMAVGSIDDFRARLETFHRDHGPKAFKSFADELHTTIAESYSIDPDDSPAGRRKPVSKVAESWMNAGPEAVDKAAYFSDRWQELKDKRHPVTDEASFVALNMKKAGFTKGA